MSKKTALLFFVKQSQIIIFEEVIITLLSLEVTGSIPTNVTDGKFQASINSGCNALGAPSIFMKRFECNHCH